MAEASSEEITPIMDLLSVSGDPCARCQILKKMIEQKEVELLAKKRECITIKDSFTAMQTELEVFDDLCVFSCLAVFELIIDFECSAFQDLKSEYTRERKKKKSEQKMEMETDEKSDEGGCRFLFPSRVILSELIDVFSSLCLFRG